MPTNSFNHVVSLNQKVTFPNIKAYQDFPKSASWINKGDLIGVMVIRSKSNKSWISYDEKFIIFAKTFKLANKRTLSLHFTF